MPARRQADPQVAPMVLPASLVANIRPPQPINVHGDRSEEWQLFEQQFEWYSAATSLSAQPEAIQIAVFMSTVGPEAVKEFNSLKLPASDLSSLSAIKTALRTRFAPKRNYRFERYLFNKISQDLDEKFDKFLTRVMVRAKKCNFGDLLDDLVVDRLIFGIRDDQLRTKLLDIDPLTLAKTTQLCRNAEACKEQCQVVSSDIQSASTSAPSVAAIKTSTVPDSSSSTFNCRNCGTTHQIRQCPAFGKTCSHCLRKNHYAAYCRSRLYQKQNPSRSAISSGSSSAQKPDPDRQLKKVAEVTLDSPHDVTADELFVNELRCENSLSLSDVLYVNTISVFSLNSLSSDEEDWFETLIVSNVKIKLKLDSGAQCNVLPLSIVRKLNSNIRPSHVRRLASFSDTSFKLPVLGEITLSAQFESRPNNHYTVSFLVVAENVAPILGRKSSVACGFILRIHSVEAKPWPEIRASFAPLFSGLGYVPAFPYDMVLVDENELKIRPARRVPFKLLEPVKKKLDLMEQLQVIRPISEPTPAVSPTVVIKKGGKIKIGIDPADLNKNLKRHHHPLKTVEEIAAKVVGSNFFTVLDCFKGYWQIPLTERTQKLLTFATPWGRYSCLRLPYGIASAPEIFQKIMSSLFQDVANVEISMDDILVHAPTEPQLKSSTCEVLSRLQKTGFKLNPQKCIFGAPSVKFLGHIFSNSGLLPDPSKIEGILALKVPSNQQELLRFLGSVTYLGKFIPNLSEHTEPLRQLLKKDVIWSWNQEQQNAFDHLKQMLTTPPVLRFYDTNKLVVLSVDASSKALGAVLLQEGQPVAYATRALPESQTLLPQIEKEALAVRFACEKFHDYIYGKPLVIESDHKPLESIFKKPIFKAPPRLKRILLDVAIYNPTVMYKKGKEIPLPDLLSRDCKPLSSPSREENEVLLILPISDSAAKDFQTEIQKDLELKLLSDIVLAGWPEQISSVPQIIRKYFNFREELTLHDGLLLKGDQILVPSTLRPKMLQLIHQGHLGIESCVKRAREALFWPSMSADIAKHVTACEICQSTQRAKPAEPLILKEIPSRPWQLLAADIFQLGAKNYLVAVDSYSGFVEVRELTAITSSKVIDTFKEWFSVHGIPEYLDTDGGPQFTSTEFQQFTKQWQFVHRTSSPHYPQSNGLAERNVATVKNLLRKCQLDRTDPYLALLNWRNTPRSPTLPSPAECLMSRKTKTLLPILPTKLHPAIPTGISTALAEARDNQKKYADTSATQQPDFAPGDSVMVKIGHRTWTPGQVINKLPPPRSYEVQTVAGHIFRRNSSFLRRNLQPFRLQPHNVAAPVEPPAQPPVSTRPKRTIRPPQRLNL